VNPEQIRTVLAEHADAIDATRPDRVDELFGRIQRHQRRRTVAAVAGAICLMLVLVAGVALLAASRTREAAPPPAERDHKKHNAIVHTQLNHRLLTYSVGHTIHWGDRTIDVGKQTNRWPPWGKLVDWVDATDDGAVFVIGQRPFGSWKAGELTIPNGPAAVWFTDGSAPVRIGTTIGDRPRGFEIAPTTEGSILAWTDPGSKTRPGQVVVYDTARMSEVARFGNADAEPLAVYPDVVYWSPAGMDCSTYPSGQWGRAACQESGPVMRFDTTSGQQSRVSRADYLADRRARPGLLTEADDHGRGSLFLDFKRRGDRLVVDRGQPTVALTGQPLRLRLPADDRNPHRLTLTQWLDPDRVVLVGTDSHDGNDLVVCRLSTGSCQRAVRVPGANPSFTAPGPAISHG
jgi:hypothetical protein